MTTNPLGQLCEKSRSRYKGQSKTTTSCSNSSADAPIVLIGEASHATHEFYKQHAVVTRRLIAEAGFTAVAVEADWPDAYRVNRWVRNASTDEDAVDAPRGVRALSPLDVAQRRSNRRLAWLR